jgi:hypothetical protein
VAAQRARRNAAADGGAAHGGGGGGGGRAFGGGGEAVAPVGDVDAAAVAARTKTRREAVVLVRWGAIVATCMDICRVPVCFVASVYSAADIYCLRACGEGMLRPICMPRMTVPYIGGDGELEISLGPVLPCRVP